MFGLEESDKTRPVDLSEADEGVHLVDVAPNRFGEVVQAADQRIGVDLRARDVTLQSQQQRVEQGETLGPSGRPSLRQFDEGARDGEARRRVVADFGCEKVARPPSTCQTTALGRNAGVREVARGIAPARPIVGRRSNGHVQRRSSVLHEHVSREQLELLPPGAPGAAEVSAVASPVGRQSTGDDEGRTFVTRASVGRLVEPELAPAAGREDAVDRLDAEAGDAQ